MRHELFGVPVDDFSLEEIKNLIQTWLRFNFRKVIVTPNPEFILLANEYPSFLELLRLADLSIADGVGLRFAISALTENKLVHRNTGIDLIYHLCSIAEIEHRNVLFLGGLPNTAECAKNILLKQFPGLKIHAIDPGIIHGNASRVEISNELLEQIRKIKPDIFVVALGQGKQEQFIKQILASIVSIRISIGVGGSFETISEIIPRAPLFWRQSGFEWVWRLVHEPKRFCRIFRASVVFPVLVISATLKQHIFLKALKRTLPDIWKQIRNKS